MRASPSADNLERFRQVFEKSPNAYLLLAPDFTILACKQAYERREGRLREALARVFERRYDQVWVGD